MGGMIYFFGARFAPRWCVFLAQGLRVVFWRKVLEVVLVFFWRMGAVRAMLGACLCTEGVVPLRRRGSFATEHMLCSVSAAFGSLARCECVVGSGKSVL